MKVAMVCACLGRVMVWGKVNVWVTKGKICNQLQVRFVMAKGYKFGYSI